MRLIGAEPSPRFESLRQDLNADEGYIIVQPTPELREFSGAVRTVISSARERGLAVLELPFGPAHGDRAGCLGALGDTLAEAKRNAYDAVGRIHFQGAVYRRDIADKALKTN